MRLPRRGKADDLRRKGELRAEESGRMVTKPSTADSLDNLSRLLGTPTAAEERAVEEEERQEQMRKDEAVLRRRRGMESEDKRFDSQSALSLAYGFIPVGKDGLLEGSARDASRDIRSARIEYLQRLILADAKDKQDNPQGTTTASGGTVLISGKAFKAAEENRKAGDDDQEGSAEGTAEKKEIEKIEEEDIGLPPGVKLSGAGDTFLLPFIPSPYVQQRGVSNKMNLFEPRWLTLFTKMIRGSPIATDAEQSEGQWLRGVSGTQSLPLPAIPEVAAYGLGYEDFARGEFVPEVAENPASIRLPEEPFAGKARYGYIYEDPERRRFAPAGTLMELTAYDTTDRRTLQVWSRAAGAFEVVQIVQMRPYGIAEVRMLPDAAGSSSASGEEEEGGEADDEELGPMEARIREACADLYFRALEVNSERILLPDELRRLLDGVTREDILAEPLDALAAFVLRNAPNASLDFLCSTSRAERLSILSRGVDVAKEAVELGFDYTYRQQWAAIGQRIQLFIIMAALSFFTLSLAANQGNGLDIPSPF